MHPALLPSTGAALALGLVIFCLSRPRATLADASLAVGLLVLALDGALAAWSLRFPDLGDAVGIENTRLILQTLVPGVWLVFSLAFARGSRVRWRLPLLAAIALPCAAGLMIGHFIEGYHQLAIDMDRRVIVLNAGGYLLQLWLLVGSVLILMNLERTFRASVGMMRWRIKYVLMGIGLLFIVRLYTSSQALLFRGVDLSLENVNAMAMILATPLLVVGLFRHRQQQTDVYPSQSILQSSATILLAGIYLLVVGVFAKLVVWLGGGSAFAVKAFLVLVTLIAGGILMQSDNARLRLRQFLSRNFHRPVFDYRKVWRRFTECSATRLEQADLSRSMVNLVAQTFEALSVTLWVVEEEQRLTRAASTFLPEDTARRAALEPEVLREATEALLARPEAVNLDLSKAAWATALRDLHPRQFPHGGDRWAAPLIGSGRLLGLLLVGDRIGGTPFDVQEVDMLNCVSDHVSGSLLNIQLSSRLLEAKELEAFQTMATFFVHDLKNAASTLSLMLRNLPIHFDDPEFRQDALRGMGKTVTHINGLISRLTLLRQGMKVELVELDLNTLVKRAIDALDPATRLRCRLELAAELPVARLDAEQLLKVLTNLLINAREAMGEGDGEIRVATVLERDQMVLTVQDQGCGMSPDFLRDGLFRPFQTTKQNGLGIGMFQSKMIVEAHGGRITATSTVGQGSTFRVQLPLAPKAATVA